MWLNCGVAALLLVYLATLLLLFRWRTNRRHEPPPVAAKLLRGPGEHLLARVQRLDEQLVTWLFLGVALPFVVGGGLVALALQLAPRFGPAALVPAIAVGLTLLTLGARGLLRQLALRRDCYLGWFGERVVAEHLEPLKARGWRVFHDVPAEGPAAAPGPGQPGRTGEGGEFNLDHVVLGPGGIFAIETKTRRARRGQPGRPSQQVHFDGQRLAFPWGEDRHGLDQAHRRALWLQRWLAAGADPEIAVQPILALPGWTIERTAPAPVLVLSPGELVAAIEARRQSPPLAPGVVERLTQALELRCRDVEF